MSETAEAREDRDATLAPIYSAAILVLTTGFRVGAGLLVLGLIVALVRQEALTHEVDSFGNVLPALLDGRARGIIDLSILALMATPLITVVTVAAGFFRAGDRRYGLLSLVVLCVLGVSVGLSLIR